MDERAVIVGGQTLIPELRWTMDLENREATVIYREPIAINDTRISIPLYVLKQTVASLLVAEANEVARGMGLGSEPKLWPQPILQKLMAAQQVMKEGGEEQALVSGGFSWTAVEIQAGLDWLAKVREKERQMGRSTPGFDPEAG